MFREKLAPTHHPMIYDVVYPRLFDGTKRKISTGSISVSLIDIVVYSKVIILSVIFIINTFFKLSQFFFIYAY